MIAPDLDETRDEDNPAARESRGHRHLSLLVALLRAFIGFITLAYVSLIGILCLHWLHAGDMSVLALALLPALMLLFLNVVAWSA